MRSNVIDTGRSVKGGVRSPQYEPVFQPQRPDPRRQRPPRQPAPPPARRRLVLAPMEGWSPLFLLAIALYCVVFSIIFAPWVGHGTFLLWSPALGLLLGLIVAKIPRIPQSILHLGACLIGYWFAIWLTSAVVFHSTWMELLGNLRATFSGAVLPGGASSSEMVFFFYLTFLCFFLGQFGSWLVYRAHQPWLLALVYCSILLVNLNYIGDNLHLLYLVLILVGALILLIARIQLVTQIEQWTREGLYTDRSWVRAITWRFMQATCVLTLLMLLVSWLLPIQQQSTGGRSFWDSIDNAVTNVSNGHVSLQSPGSIVLPYQAPTNFFGDQLTITGSVSLPTGEVLTYSGADPHYLEGFTFNRFDGSIHWTTSLAAESGHNYAANEGQEPDSNRSDFKQVTTTVMLVQPPGGSKNYIFGPAEPISFSLPTTVLSDGTAGAWLKQTPLSRGESYQVTSSVPPTDAQSLSDIPLPANNPFVWESDSNNSQLTANYLQVPQNLSPNELKTLRQWTSGASNAYSALKMLESHLSNPKEFQYSVDNPPIPKNVDVVDWLLQQRSGYCTYYASAMAIMARQLLIPTRIVNGFSQGKFDSGRKVWSVSGSDAHSWVQAYFPGVGWVSFDPTPGFAPNATPAASAVPTQTPTKAAVHPSPTATALRPTPPAQKRGQPTTTPARREGTPVIDQAVLRGLSIATLLFCFVLVVVLLLRRWWLNLYAGSPFVSGLFWRLCRIASWAGLGPKGWQTPYEYGYMLSQHFSQQSTPLWRLTDLFVRERWGGASLAPREHEQKVVEGFWPGLRGSLLRRVLRRKKR